MTKPTAPTCAYCLYGSHHLCLAGSDWGRSCGCTNARCHPGQSPAEGPTVKRASLWDGVVDTHATETELNGWRPSQGVLL